MMATPRATLDDLATVEWAKFGLIDDDRVEPGELGWAALGSPETMLTGKNGAVFRSAGVSHMAPVRLESWDAEPPASEGTWDVVWAGTIPLTSGVLRLAFVTMGVSDNTIAVGPAGEYWLRVYCRGREAAKVGGDRPDLGGGPYEHWVMQFWPRRQGRVHRETP
ncbi:hypothetical protein HUW46_06412 [Amycolatopsis sp. CA-230715]|nr:hypothetical protein HUW46_06412 [Amycolatopsis sp. CA-230715]